VSYPLENIILDIYKNEIQNLGELISQPTWLYTTSPSFYKTALTQYLDVDEAVVDKYQLSEYLYSEQGIGSLLVSSLYKDTLSLKMDSNFVLEWIMVQGIVNIVCLIDSNLLLFSIYHPVLPFYL